MQTIKPIDLGGANCYLVQTGDDFVLIDTGFSRKRSDLEKELGSAGCEPGKLKLIVITHGDFDHTGNCAFLRDKYGARIVMHVGDSGMAERGDMFWNRKSNLASRLVVRILLLFSGGANSTDLNLTGTSRMGVISLRTAFRPRPFIFRDIPRVP